jgi:hypothetical protein
MSLRVVDYAATPLTDRERLQWKFAKRFLLILASVCGRQLGGGCCVRAQIGDRRKERET